MSKRRYVIPLSLTAIALASLLPACSAAEKESSPSQNGKAVILSSLSDGEGIVESLKDLAGNNVSLEKTASVLAITEHTFPIQKTKTTYQDGNVHIEDYTINSYVPIGQIEASNVSATPLDEITYYDSESGQAVTKYLSVDNTVKEHPENRYEFNWDTYETDVIPIVYDDVSRNPLSSLFGKDDLGSIFEAESIGGVIQPLLFDDVFSNPFKALSAYDEETLEAMFEFVPDTIGGSYVLKEAYASKKDLCAISGKFNGFFLNDHFQPIFVSISIAVDQNGLPYQATIETPIDFLSYGTRLEGTYVNYVTIAYPESVVKPELAGLYDDKSSEGKENHALSLALEKLGEAYLEGNYTQQVAYDGKTREMTYKNYVDAENDIYLCTNKVAAYDRTEATDGSDAYVEASQGAYTAVANRIQDETIDAYSLYSYFLERDPRYFSGDKLEVTSGSFVNKMAKFDLNPGDISADFFTKEGNTYVFDLDADAALQNQDGFSGLLKMSLFPVCDNIFQYLFTVSVTPTEAGLYTYSNTRNYTTSEIHEIAITLDGQGDIASIVLDIESDNDGYGSSDRATVTLTYSGIGATDVTATGDEDIDSFAKALKGYALKKTA